MLHLPISSNEQTSPILLSSDGCWPHVIQTEVIDAVLEQGVCLAQSRSGLGAANQCANVDANPSAESPQDRCHQALARWESGALGWRNRFTFPHWLSLACHDAQVLAELQATGNRALLECFTDRDLCVLQASDDLWASPQGTRDAVARLKAHRESLGLGKRLHHFTRTGGTP